MPTYDYECGACGEVHEFFQRISEDPIKKCPGCGKNKLKRLLGGGAGFIFKGSGFYETDYRKPEYTAKAKAEAEAAKPKSDSKSDSKSSSDKSSNSSGPSSSKSSSSKAST
ncbi:MAG: zinc ribbon domain-containing protein [Planctomycetota bacterium]